MAQKVSASSQDYLEAILELSDQQKGSVHSIDISKKLGVSRASVNRAVGVLKEAGLVSQERYSTLFLTEKGREEAVSVLGRHVALRGFLTEILGVSGETAEEDACKMEHIISEETICKLKKFMDKR